jgi:hypothetical protein
VGSNSGRFSVSVIMFNDTFNNISAVSLRSALLVEETRVPGESHRPAASHCQTLSHNVVSGKPRLCGIRTHNVSLSAQIDDNEISMCCFSTKHVAIKENDVCIVLDQRV